ncbi:hypothetical protein, partial [Actinocorallia lasiicapitis]
MLLSLLVVPYFGAIAVVYRLCLRVAAEEEPAREAAVRGLSPYALATLNWWFLDAAISASLAALRVQGAVGTVEKGTLCRGEREPRDPDPLDGAVWAALAEPRTTVALRSDP